MPWTVRNTRCLVTAPSPRDETGNMRSELTHIRVFQYAVFMKALRDSLHTTIRVPFQGDGDVLPQEADVETDKCETMLCDEGDIVTHLANEFRAESTCGRSRLFAAAYSSSHASRSSAPHEAGDAKSGSASDDWIDSYL